MISNPATSPEGDSDRMLHNLRSLCIERGVTNHMIEKDGGRLVVTRQLEQKELE